jgi:hypothetical protein
VPLALKAHLKLAKQKVALLLMALLTPHSEVAHANHLAAAHFLL